MSAATAARPGFFGWWLEEVGAFWPRRTQAEKRPLKRFAVALVEGESLHLIAREGRRVRDLGSVARVRPDRRDTALSTALARIKRRNLPVVLRLGAAQAVVAHDVLPKQALDDLRLVIGHKLDLLTPFTPGQAYYDAALVEAVDRNRVEVVVAAVPKHVLDKALALVRRLGLDPVRADVVDEDPADPPQLDLLGRAVERRGPSRLPFLLVLLPLVAAVAFAGLSYDTWRSRSQQIAERESFASALEGRVADLPELSARLSRLQDEAGFINRQRVRQPSVIVTFEALSRLLPDEVWLDSLRVQGDRLTISGYAPDASALVPLLEEAPNFADVRFEAPSMRVEVSREGIAVPAERFSLAARVTSRRETG